MMVPGTDLVAAAAAPGEPSVLVPVAPERPVDRHPAAVYLARLAPGSRDAQLRALRTIATIVSGGRANVEDLDWGALRYPHTAAIRAELAGRYAPATANRHLAALRGVLTEAWRLGLVPGDDYRRAIDVRAVRGQRLPAGRAVSRGELVALFASCASEARTRRRACGARDAALLAVLYGAGLRRSEAAAIDLADVDRERLAITVRGKGNKVRVVYLEEAGAGAALEAWLRLRDDTSGPLFVAVNKGGGIDQAPRGLTGTGILRVLQRRARTAGVASFSPHDLRRTFIGDLLDAGADVVTVQRMAGHANVQTTAAYDRRPQEAQRRAAALLHVPYLGDAD